jgi:hypothetical protein
MCVGVDLDPKHWFAAQGRTFRDLAEERLLLCIRPDGPRLELERSAMAQRVFFFAAADLYLVFREAPCRGVEILGCVLASVGHPKRL